MNKQASGTRCQVSGKKFQRFFFSYNLKPRTYNLQHGFTLLLAALISSVVLSLGVSIFAIAFKQINLSSMGRESQFAFYAADTGMECALYWDVRHELFGTSTPPDTTPHFESGFTDPKCAVKSLNIPTTNLPTSYPYTITFQFEPAANKCAIITVTKCNAAGQCNPARPDIRTIIHADGFNTSCLTIGTTARALQRSVELYY